MMHSLTTIVLFLRGSIAWKLPHLAFGTFESPHGNQMPMSLTDDNELGTFGASSFAGLRTFANLPFIDCFSDPDIRDHKYDIAVFGAPHDTTISGRPAANSSVSATPRILTLGGDHTTTLSALRSTYQRWGPVSVIHFDSHIDTWDPAVLGGGISDYAGLNHGTFLHIAHEEHLILNNSIHAGIRAPLIRRKGDLRNDVRCGFEIITARDLDKLGATGVISKIKERVGGSRVYISVDIDVLDPAYAPATGTAEPGGWSTRELLTILDGLEGLAVVGADVVEVAPAYDNNGETTVLAAAEVAYSLIDLMVLTPVQSKADAKKDSESG
ncbi:arginase family protein (proclavaminate amidinohydrolase) [Colletotrichum tofieldiae]|uniref:Arginase family protein (Proclavaminate amidinohydrolase) n=1 Tax=Colletotrichum tofieldiae TaxID=708197 RepID=A0A166R6W9_9PEZI|nr:arginase family protein (proclavaminate amidinohydrolase) [Colletotrichum tofieldiae]